MRVLGGAVLYKINVANPVVKKLIEFNNFLCWKNVDHVDGILIKQPMLR
ncbi:MAG TPA: hypothetical protein VJJ21_04210 [Candidatus Nanoarchaeia archaeon]|nr:hypothetical protein [Candidatus Nanoarchaeia archaeon]